MPCSPSLDYGQLAARQQQQPGLLACVVTDPGHYSFQLFGNAQLVCYRTALNAEWRIVVPDAVLSHLIAWYHSVLGHAGAQNLVTTLRNTFTHPRLNNMVTNHVHFCTHCQQHKLSGPGYGELSTREALVQPWFEVVVDTIGPWMIQIANQEPVRLYAVTIIDTVTNLVEMVRINTPASIQAAFAFETGWLFRYPRPVWCIHDQGPEYQGPAFAALLHMYGIANIPISVRNPQANAICECMHQVVGNLLRVLVFSQQPQNRLATASYALHATVHRTLGVSPGALVFHRNMLIDVPYVANMLLLRERQQAVIDYNLRCENKHCHTYDY